MLSCCAINACKAVETGTPQQLKLGGHVEYSMSGGFAGIRQSLTIQDTGQIEAHDEKYGKVVRGQLDAARLARLRATLIKISANSETTSPRLGTGCTDCYQHTVKATFGDRRFQVYMNSMALQASPNGELVRTLSLILREVLSRPATANE